jgi:hypothetical protein
MRVTFVIFEGKGVNLRSSFSLMPASNERVNSESVKGNSFGLFEHLLPPLPSGIETNNNKH